MLAAVLAAAALATGTASCSRAGQALKVNSVGGGSPTASADLAAQIQRYRDCLTANGVKLLDRPTSEGLPQIDKEHTNVAAIASALEKCRSQMPTAVDAPKIDAATIQAQQRLAQCLRAHGVPEYPDPDPVTGQPKLSDELSNRLKSDQALIAAMESCRTQVGVAPTGGTIGG